ncbi:MAG TPA: tetratricopeptide repeat protein [Blastocatellia bacterium]|nr:tetratricopeptide repeat protein [Blastocatellia bacterium]
MKNPGRESKPSSPTPPPSPETKPAKDNPIVPPPNITRSSEGGEQDPKAISESLRRIRTSGPLIIEALKQNSERAREIIEQSIQGLSDNKTDVKRDAPPTPPPPPAPPPVQKAKKRSAVPSRPATRPATRPVNQAATQPMNQETRLGPAKQISAGSASSKPANASLDNHPGSMVPAQSVAVRTAAQTVAQKVSAAVAATQSVTRKTTGFLSRSSGKNAHTAGAGGHNGPSTVLVQASGFKPQSGVGPKVLIALVALLVLLAAGIYFPFRDRLLTPAQSAPGDRNLLSAEEKSADLVRQGETDRAQRKYGAAVEQFHRALELAPNNPEIQFLLAQTHLDAGQMDDAMRGYREILRIRPEHLDARLQLAEVYRRRGNLNAAYKEYQNIIELNQNSMQAAAALDAIEKILGAIQPTEQTAKIALPRGSARPRPTVPPLPGPAIRAQVPSLTQRPSAVPDINPPMAISSARPEEKPDPRVVAESHKNLGVRYYRVRQYRAALNEFLRALSLTPDDQDLCYLIGSSYHGLGLLADAHSYYRRVYSGPYLGPAQSGTKQTEKAAREASKRRETLKFQTSSSELKNELDSDRSGKSFMNRILESLRQ